MKPFPLALVVFFALVGQPAFSDDCSSVNQLRAYGKNHFKDIDGGGGLPEGSVRESKFMLPNAKSCYLFIASPTSSTYSCTWLVGKGLEKKNEAVSIYEALVQSILRCVGRPETLVRAERRTKQGANAHMLDTFAGIRTTQRRSFEVTYGYENYWWSVEVDYDVDDDVPP